jgi:hypothetical protein
MAERSDIMINPYIAGSPVFGADFYGRQQLAQELLDPRQTCIYLVGCRRSGKTSMLHHVEKQAQSITLFLNLLKTGRQATGISAELARQIKRQTDRHSILAEVDLSTTADECQIIESLAAVAEQHNQSVLLLWDEAEKLLELDEQRLGCLRSSLQDKPHLRTILAASKQLSKLGAQRNGAAWAFLDGFTTRHLPPLSEHEAETLIRQTTSAGNLVQADASVVAQIIEMTGQQPYLIQLLCRRLFDGASGLLAVTEDDLVVDAGLSDIFQTDYEALTGPERSILLTLAKHDAASVADLLKILSIQVDQLRSYLHGLRKIGLVRGNSSRYQIASHFLRTWLGMDCAQETRAITVDTMGLSRPGDSGPVWAGNDIVQRQLAEARTNLRLIEERTSTYVLAVDVPLQLVKEERRLKAHIAELEQQLNRA